MLFNKTGEGAGASLTEAECGVSVICTSLCGHVSVSSSRSNKSKENPHYSSRSLERSPATPFSVISDLFILFTHSSIQSRQAEAWAGRPRHGRTPNRETVYSACSGSLGSPHGWACLKHLHLMPNSSYYFSISASNITHRLYKGHNAPELNILEYYVHTEIFLLQWSLFIPHISAPTTILRIKQAFTLNLQEMFVQLQDCTTCVFEPPLKPQTLLQNLFYRLRHGHLCYSCMRGGGLQSSR